MLELPHVALGAAIATKIPNPLISVPLAFASHFLLERVPHWNPHLNTEKKKFGGLTKKTKTIIIVDSTLSLIFGSFIAYRSLPDTSMAINVLLCSLAAALPDLMEAPYFFMGVKNRFIKSWIASQKAIQVDTDMFWGVSTQIVTLAAIIFWIFN